MGRNRVRLLRPNNWKHGEFFRVFSLLRPESNIQRGRLVHPLLENAVGLLILTENFLVFLMAFGIGINARGITHHLPYRGFYADEADAATKPSVLTFDAFFSIAAPMNCALCTQNSFPIAVKSGYRAKE